MQRSASSSSSYHIPLSPNMTYANGTPQYSNPSSQTGTPDWTAMHHAQSYLPSLTPVNALSGRSTPSPLPSLGELRTLQRSNSAAARAHAMSRLTGGRNTPSDEEALIQSARPNLQRADSLGMPRMLGMPVVHRQEVPPHASSSDLDVRPRLQRSFTVSSSNMGEERRSAVGRRMVERLGERKAARDKEEDEVRRLWEARRAQEPEAPPPLSSTNGLLVPPERTVSRRDHEISRRGIRV